MSKSIPPGPAPVAPFAFYESDQKDLTKNCAICNLTHNMNLHSQADKVKYFRQKKAEDPNNNVPNPTPEHA